MRSFHGRNEAKRNFVAKYISTPLRGSLYQSSQYGRTTGLGCTEAE